MLTPQQIASKFSLPQVPDMMTDVTVPPNTMMEASVANGVSPKADKGIFTGGNGGGGGVQFQIQIPRQYLDSSWFAKGEPLPERIPMPASPTPLSERAMQSVPGIMGATATYSSSQMPRQELDSPQVSPTNERPLP
jgi:hypothetical protein